MSLFRQWAVLFALIAAGATATALLVPKPEKFAANEIAAAAARATENVLWIDARNETEFAKAHIAGAFNLNEDNWAHAIAGVLERWTPGQPVIVYCSSVACQASHAVAARLAGDEYNLTNVRVLHGGHEAWLAADETGKNAP